VLAVGWRREHVLKESFKLAEMFACGGVDDHGSVLAVTVDFPHAQSVSLEPPPDLGGPEGNV